MDQEPLVSNARSRNARLEISHKPNNSDIQKNLHNDGIMKLNLSFSGTLRSTKNAALVLIFP